MKVSPGRNRRSVRHQQHAQRSMRQRQEVSVGRNGDNSPGLRVSCSISSRGNGERTPSINTANSSIGSSRRSRRPVDVAPRVQTRHKLSKEYEDLKRKHEGGIFATKYPFKSNIFSSPKMTRIEVGIAEKGNKLAIKWGSNAKEMYFADIKDVTLGIKSNTFRRFESQLMKSKEVQPNHCVSVHNNDRTLDPVLKSSKD